MLDRGVDVNPGRGQRPLSLTFTLGAHSKTFVNGAYPAMLSVAQVMIAVQDDAAGNLTNAAKRALSSVGAGHDEVNALAIRKRSSFALIGRKGATPGSVPQVMAKKSSIDRQSPASVHSRFGRYRVCSCYSALSITAQRQRTYPKLARKTHLVANFPF